MSTTTTRTVKAPTAEQDLEWLTKSYSEKDATAYGRALRFHRLVTTRGYSAPKIEAHLKRTVVNATVPSSKQISFYLRVLRAVTTGGRVTTDAEYGQAFTAMNRLDARGRASVETALTAGASVSDALTTGATDSAVTQGNGEAEPVTTRTVTAESMIQALQRALTGYETLSLDDQILVDEAILTIQEGALAKSKALAA